MTQSLPPVGKLTACDVSEEYTAVALRYWEEGDVSDKIELRIGPAVDTLYSLLNEGAYCTCDLAFIDADKVNYSSYYESCIELLCPAGLILIDNVLWNARPARSDETDKGTVAIRTLNARLHTDERIDVSFLSIGDGLTINTQTLNRST